MIWDIRFLDLAKHISIWSKDPSTKVGAVIFDSDKRIVSIGYNGFPKGVCDDPQRYDDRDIKYRMVVHAEANAILKVAKSTNNAHGSTLYITLSPCKDCCKLILQSGITRMVYLNAYKDTTAIDFLRNSGVEVVQRELPE